MKESELKSLIMSIKRTESQPAITSLYKESYPRLKAIFDEFASSSPSAITSNIDLFELCFECLSLFVKHKVTKGDGTLKEDEDDIEVILDRYSINNINDIFLPSMIRVENILRVKEEEEEEEEEGGIGTDDVGVNSITMLLFRIIGIATCVEMTELLLSPTILPQISSLLSKMFILGLSKKFEDSFIEDILQTCRNIAFADDDPTKNSLLSLLLPHILPWMKKYPDKKFFFLWTNILKNITNDKDNTGPHKDRSSQLWFVFHPVLDVIKDTASKGITFDDAAVIRCLLFFANLSCIPSQAVEVHDCIKDGLLDGWFEMIKKKSEEGKGDGNRGIKYSFRLISMLSTVPSLVPHISPKYDTNMEWCKDNGGWSGDYTRYLINCYPSLKKWSKLVESIKKCPDSASTSKLYHNHRDEILSVFLTFQSKSEIKEHKREIVLCAQCLQWFVQHSISGNAIYLPIPDLNDLIDTFIDHLSRCEEVLEGDVDEKYCGICINYSGLFQDKWDSFLPKISPTFQHILERGSKEKLGGDVALKLLNTMCNISNSPSSSTRSSILTLIKPYIRDWLRIYNDSECYGQWMFILSKITLSSDDSTPNKSICSEAWPLFHPVLDVVKREFVGDKIVEDGHEWVLVFFSHLCYVPSHAVEIYDNVKDLLDVWFTVIKKEEHEWGIKFWSILISMFSTVPSLVPHISPKYDVDMEWCKNTGVLVEWCRKNGIKEEVTSEDYTKYLGNCYSFLKKWSELAQTILKSPDSESISKLYREHRDEILSVFLAFQSKSEIEEHKREIVLCAQCLRWFVRHVICENKIYLAIPDLNDLIDTFIGHLSRCEEVLEGDVDEEYCVICMCYTFKVKDKKDSFLQKISPTFQRILERGSKEKLGGDFTLYVLKTLRNVSLCTSSSTRSSILTLIKPYIRDWLRIYNDSECYGHWMIILSQITLSSDNSTPNKSMCSEAWPLFHPVLDVVKRKFFWDKIVKDDHERVLLFFSHLCCDPSHAVEIYDNVNDLLVEWFEVINKNEHKRGIKFWSSLISMFSTVPYLVPFISPKFDILIKTCYQNGAWEEDYSRYLENCKFIIRFVKKWSELVEAIKKSPDSESTSKLYRKHRDEILSVFLAFQSKSEIEEHKREIILCVQCLRWFVRHYISGNDIFLPIPDLNDLIDTFIDHLSRCEEVLEGDVDEKYCGICINYSGLFQDKWDSFLPKISPTFQHILERGSKEKLRGDVHLNLLKTLRNISNFRSSSTRSSILTLIKPYIKDWLRIYNDSKCYGEWMFILSTITLSSDKKSHNKSVFSEAWYFFHPVLDVVKREFVGDKIVGDNHERVLYFFSNLCRDQAYAVEICDNVKDLLDGWYKVLKGKEHKWGIKYGSLLKKKTHENGIICWSKLISMISTVPSLVPYISPKYDTNMEWCKNNGGWSRDYTRYIDNCYPSLKKWSELVESIKKCPDSESTSKLYHEHRDEILSVLLAFQSKSEIKEPKREIILCVQCLQCFVRHVISGNKIYLPIPDLNDLIDTFIDHLSRCEEVLEGNVDEEYCVICMGYTFKIYDKLDSFLPKISPTFQRILERGSKEKLGGNVALNLLTTLRNISISLSSSTKSSILTLIKPYIRAWLRIYNDSECYGHWMNILSYISLSSDDSTPNKSLCSEAWPLFHPVLDVVKREFVGDKIVEDNHE
ncbi:hypothetical protein ADUPG1_006356, partial [Aduncisulcus paluster]